MQSIARQISLIGRKADSDKDRRRVLRIFDEWLAAQKELSAVRRRDKTLLLIRLDDIGDYLLFRNQLRMYKRSPRWQKHVVTLLGNVSWEPRPSRTHDSARAGYGRGMKTATRGFTTRPAYAT